MQEFSSSAELERVRGIAESARSAADRVQRQVNALDTEMGRYERRGVRSFIAVLILIVLTSAGAWWLNSRLTAQESSIAKVLGAEGAIDGLLQRLSSAESALKALPTQLNTAPAAVQPQDKNASAVLKPDVPSNVASENRIAELTQRIASLEAQHSDDGTQLASLRDELATSRRSTSEQAAPVRPNVPRRQESVAAIVRPFDGERRDFQIGTAERANELVPGVLLTVKETNVERQEINGWIYLQEHHQFVWLKNQKLGQPITVYDTRDKQAHEIVFTKVRRNDAAGYVSSPKPAVSVSAAN